MAELECRFVAATTLGNNLIGDLSGPAAVAQLEELTVEIGAPWHIAETVRVRGLHKLFSVVAPDVEGALEDFRDAVELDSKSRTNISWAQMNVALAMTLANEPGAAQAIRKAIDIAYDARNWAAIRTSLEIDALQGSANFGRTTVV